MKFEASVDAKLIRSVLAESKVGDVVTYEQLSKAIGRDVREHARSALGTARRGLLRDERIVFGVEQNVGLVRLNDEEIVSSAESDRRRIQRTAKRSLQRLSVVDFDKLSEEKKRAHIVASAQIGVVAMFAKSSSSKRIESKVTGSDAIPIGETLKLFGAS